MYARTINMTGKGQIVVPKEIRKNLGLKRNSKLLVVQRGDDIVLKKPISLENLFEDFPGLKAATERSFARVWKDEEEGYWESYLND